MTEERDEVEAWAERAERLKTLLNQKDWYTGEVNQAARDMLTHDGHEFMAETDAMTAEFVALVLLRTLPSPVAEGGRLSVTDKIFWMKVAREMDYENFHQLKRCVDYAKRDADFI